MKDKLYCVNCEKVWDEDELVRTEPKLWAKGIMGVEVKCPKCGATYQYELSAVKNEDNA